MTPSIEKVTVEPGSAVAARVGSLVAMKAPSAGPVIAGMAGATVSILIVCVRKPEPVPAGLKTWVCSVWVPSVVIGTEAVVVPEAVVTVVPPSRR
jgi:hypothetical protein